MMSSVLATSLRIVTCAGVIAGTWAEEFSNSFSIDLGPKDYRIDVTGNDLYIDLNGQYETSVHATWMLRLEDQGYYSPSFYGGLGLACGFYESGDDLEYQVFEMRGDFGPCFYPAPFVRLGVLFFGGWGYHDLRLPRAVALLTDVSGVGNLGFSYGANAELTVKLGKSFHLSGQVGFRGLYVSYGDFENGDLVRSIEASTFGLMAGAGIDFAF